jgi:hypothetical protein
MDLGRRLLFVAVQISGWQRKPSPFQKDVEPQAADAGLRDRWIDGFW